MNEASEQNEEPNIPPLGERESEEYIARMTRAQEWLCDIFAIILAVAADIGMLFAASITPLGSMLGAYNLLLDFWLSAGLGLLYVFVLRPRLFAAPSQTNAEVAGESNFIEGSENAIAEDSSVL